MRIAIALLLGLVPGLVPLAVPAQTAGPARVVDGDTLEVGGRRLDLDGIDAPEPGQQCARYGQLWSCGAEAGTVLERVVGGRPVDCRERGRADDGASLARCRIGPVDLNREMLSAGMALALPEGGPDYAQAEAAAREAGRGLWSGLFVAPAEWRQGVRLAPPTASERCRIKGDIAGGRRLYYVPDHPGHAAVRIDEAAGERWFCGEIEAIRAGWRAAP